LPDLELQAKIAGSGGKSDRARKIIARKGEDGA
jgi:hypothetical protein